MGKKKGNDKLYFISDRNIMRWNGVNFNIHIEKALEIK